MSESTEKSKSAVKSKSAEKASAVKSKARAEKASAKKVSAKVGAKKERAKKESPKKESPRKDLTDPGAFEAALALLARRVEHCGLQAPSSLLCVRSAALSASRASALYRAGIARLRRAAALLGPSSSMIGASLEGCPKRGQPTEGKNRPSQAV